MRPCCAALRTWPGTKWPPCGNLRPCRATVRPAHGSLRTCRVTCHMVPASWHEGGADCPGTGASCHQRSASYPVMCISWRRMGAWRHHRSAHEVASVSHADACGQLQPGQSTRSSHRTYPGSRRRRREGLCCLCPEPVPSLCNPFVSDELAPTQPGLSGLTRTNRHLHLQPFSGKSLTRSLYQAILDNGTCPEVSYSAQEGRQHTIAHN
jgi:hypothetical protein